MTSQEKIEKESIIKKYLQELFPECDIQTQWDFDSGDLLFRIDEADGQIKHRGEITFERLEDTRAENIPDDLNSLQLESYLEKAEGEKVLISNKGVSIHKS